MALSHPSEPPEPLPGPVFTSFWLGGAPGADRLMLVGELDLVTAGKARTALHRAQGETRSLICDLGDIWFVDVAGLRVLLDAAERARRTGGRLTLANCPAIVPRMLALLHVEDGLDIEAAPIPAARRRG